MTGLNSGDPVASQNWVLTVRIQSCDAELELVLADLYARLGDRVRVLTQAEWLYNQNREHVPFRSGQPLPVWNGPKDRR